MTYKLLRFIKEVREETSASLQSNLKEAEWTLVADRFNADSSLPRNFDAKRLCSHRKTVRKWYGQWLHLKRHTGLGFNAATGQVTAPDEFWESLRDSGRPKDKLLYAWRTRRAGWLTLAAELIDGSMAIGELAGCDDDTNPEDEDGGETSPSDTSAGADATGGDGVEEAGKKTLKKHWRAGNYKTAYANALTTVADNGIKITNAYERVSTCREEATAALYAMGGMSEFIMYRVARRFAADTGMAEIFIAMPMEGRRTMVEDLTRPTEVPIVPT